MKKVIVDLRDMVLTILAALFSTLGAVIALPGRVLTYIGEGCVNLGGFITKFVGNAYRSKYSS